MKKQTAANTGTATTIHDAAWAGDHCYGHGITGFQQPAKNCTICFPPNLVEWRVRNYTKTEPLHAYDAKRRAEDDCWQNPNGLCGRGWERRITRTLDDAKKTRKSPLWKCPQCDRLAGMPGDVRATLAKVEGR